MKTLARSEQPQLQLQPQPQLQIQLQIQEFATQIVCDIIV